MTVGVLTACYVGYCSVFGLVVAAVGTKRTVPIIPPSTKPSPSSLETTRLAISAFGPGHWSANSKFRYYDTQRGYWLFYNDQLRHPDGKKWEFWPVAVILRNAKTQALQTVLAEKASVEFNQPLDISKPGSGAVFITHGNLNGNVLIRDDQGTPDIADDLSIGPLSHVVYEESSGTIVSNSHVTGVQRDTTLDSEGVVIELNPRTKTSGEDDGFVDFEGIRTITLKPQVRITTQDVGVFGVVPGGNPTPAKDPGDEAKPTKGDDAEPNDKKRGGKEVPKSAARPRRPGLATADSLRIDLPRHHRPPRVGPPRPNDPTFATLQRNVIVQQGDPQAPDRMHCDELHLTFQPAPKNPTSVPAATDAEAMDDADVGVGPVAQLALVRAQATGHAVWLESTSQNMTAHGNELIYQRLSLEDPNQPDKIYFRGDRYVTVNIPEFEPPPRTDQSPGARGPLRAIHTVRSMDINIFQYQPGGPPPEVVATGPGILESRRQLDAPIERTATWQDRLKIVTLGEGDDLRRKITLIGRPMLRDLVQQTELSAEGQIVAQLEPKRVDSKDEAEANSAASAGPTSEAFRLEWMKADNQVVLASGPAMGLAREEALACRLPGANVVLARTKLGAVFPEEPSATAPNAKPKAPANALAQAERPKQKAKPENSSPPEPAAAETKPPDPALIAQADSVYAEMRMQPGQQRKAEMLWAQLEGGVSIHQEPAPGKAKGTDISGDFADWRNRGEGKGLARIRGDAAPAVAANEGYTIQGPLLEVDQARDQAWVRGPGTFLKEDAADLLTDPDARATSFDPTADPPAANKPKRKQGPLRITWTERMDFFGRPFDEAGKPLPARAEFRGAVHAQTDDGTMDCKEIMIARMDRPIPFQRPDAKTGRNGDAEPKPPQPNIVVVECRKDVDVTSLRRDVAGTTVLEKRRIQGQVLIYDKRSGEFTVDDVGQNGLVHLYRLKMEALPGPPPLVTPDRPSVRRTAFDAGDARKPDARPANAKRAQSKAADAKKQVARQPERPKPPLPPVELTRIQFAKSMKGRFAVGPDGSPTQTGRVDFEGDIEAVIARVANLDAEIDPDSPPSDFKRMTARRMFVTTEPGPKNKTTGKAETYVYLTADEDANVQTKDKALQGDQITYDTSKDLSFLYGYENGVTIVDQAGAGQPASYGRGSAIMFNHATGQAQIIDPKSFTFIDPRSGLRAGIPREAKPKKKKDPDNFKLPVRGDKERKSFGR